MALTLAGHEVVVVGGGMSGIACARALQDAGRPVRVREAHDVGGRTRSLPVAGRDVEVGAAYFTASVPAFSDVVSDWLDRGLAIPWTDTFHVATPDGVVGTRTGPQRYTAPRGLAALVQDLAGGLDVSTGTAVTRVDDAGVDGSACASVALAVPSPVALQLLDGDLVDEREAASAPFDPCLVVLLQYADRTWAEFDAVFVNDSATLTFVVDDGRRRGDGAAVLVAYVSSVLSAVHLRDPERVVDPVLQELRSSLSIGVEPTSVQVVPWQYAKPRRPAPQPFFLGSRGVGLCGDAWHAPSRLEAAYLSGRALGRAIAQTSGDVTRPVG